MVRRALLVLAMCLLAGAALAGCFLFGNRPPVAHVEVQYNVVEGSPMVVDLDASGTSDPDGDPIAAYSWSFSDDLAVIAPAAYTTSVPYPILRVRCPTQGQYTATLFVRDERGAYSEPLAGIAIVVPQPLPSP